MTNLAGCGHAIMAKIPAVFLALAFIPFGLVGCCCELRGAPARSKILSRADKGSSPEPHHHCHSFSKTPRPHKHHDSSLICKPPERPTNLRPTTPLNVPFSAALTT